MADADPNPPSAHPSAHGAAPQSAAENTAVVMPMAVLATASLYARRRRRNGIATAVSLALTTLGLACLVLILGTLLWRGLSGLTPQVFTEMTPAPPGDGGGLLNAIVGSLILTVIGVAIGAPLGILAGTYMAEYGRHDRLTSVVRFINDILLSAPSIVVGLFIYEVLVANTIGHFSGIAGAVALAVLVIPVVVRTTEDMLLLVPNPLREAASALGLPRSVVVVRIAYRAARAGMVTGVLLAIARISGETAPLVFTSGTNQFWSVDLNHEIASLPMFIFQGANSPYPAMKQLAWTGALMITLTVLVLSITARSLTAKSTSS